MGNLTNSQKSIWVTEQYYKGSSINNICGSAIIEEKLDFEKLEQAIQIMCQKHDNFRLQLNIKDGEVEQVLSEKKKIQINTLNVANPKELAVETEKIVRTPFNLENSELFKFYIIKFENGEGGFLYQIHHLISDGWTLAFVCNETIKIYSALKQNKEVETKAIYSYIDYINDEKEYLESEKFQKDKKYWEEKFETIPEVAIIPGSKENPDESDPTGERKQFTLDKTFVEEMKQYCKQNKISLYNFFMAVYAIYIGEISNLDKFVIGTPILNRTNFKEKNAAGMFINMAPFKINMSQASDFKTFIKNISIDSMGMLKHQKYSYQSLLENLREKNKSIPNLYNILLSYQITNAQMSGEDIKYKAEWTFNGCCAENMDIQIYDLNDTGCLNIAYDYKTSIYEKQDIENVHKRILNIIKQVISKENIDLKDIEIVTPEEKKQLVTEFNKTKLEYNPNIPIIKYFEEQAQNTPENVAIVFENKKMTYKELNEKANSLAYELRRNGVINNTIVGIMQERSLEMMIAILAVLKSGGSYIPIAPDYPIDRVKYMLKDSNASIVLTTNKIKTDKKIIDIKLNNEIYKENKENLENISTSEDLSYLIYTSGSTGTPKGVMLKQKNLTNFYNAMKKSIDYLQDDKQHKIISITTVSFDIFLFETLMSLTKGLTLYMTNENEQKITSQLEKLIKQNEIEILQTTPSVMKFHLDNLEDKEDIKSLKYIMLAGEPLPKSLVEQLKETIPGVTIYNGYGPSETTIFSTTRNVTNLEKVTIGKPIANTQIYILNKNQKLMPQGTIGEIYIAGDGVGKGYMNKKEQTESSFIKNPFIPNSTMYKVGDLGAYDEHGEITCYGRIDNQIKIRGLRVELPEIEKQMLSSSNVKNTVVIKKEINGRDVLCAYYIPVGPVNEEAIKTILKDKLPQYMIPQYFVKLENMPYTPNGKIDKRALPTPNIKEKTKEKIEIRNEIDKELLQIIQKMMHIGNISLSDSLIDLGGDSLTAITLLTKISSKFNVQLYIKDIMSNKTIKDISDIIRENQEKGFSKIKIEKAPEQDVYPLSSAQKRIYYNSKMIGENNIVYNVSGGILVEDILDKEKVQYAFEKIIERHSALRTSFILQENKVVQKIKEKIDFKIPVYHNTESGIQEIINHFSKPFDLETELLLRVELHYIDNKKTMLLIESHHIAIDGTSLNNLIIEFERLYNGEKLKKIPIQYKDYAVWENKFNESELIKKSENYWINKFKEAEFSQLNLPYDYKTTANRSYKGNKISNIIDEKQFRKIERYAKKIGASPYVLFISAFFILLYKYTGQEEIMLGSPIANRDINETKRMIGMFVNNIVVKGNINSDETFQEFLNKMKEQVLDDLSNQPYPFDMLVKKLGIKSDNSRSPLFDVMFTYQNKEENMLKLKDNEVEVIEIDNNIAKFNLSLEIKPKTHTINVEYCTDLFKKQTIEKLFEHYMNVIDTILADNNVKIKDISVISEQEKNKILYEFNDTKMDYPTNKIIPELFEQQVNNNKNVVAVKYGENEITYDELNKKSTYLANELMQKGIKTGDVVGINLNRSIELIIAMMAVLKIGAIYMPMYVDYPKERLEYMLKNSNAKMLIYKDNKDLEFDGIKEKISSFKTMKKNDELNKEITLNSQDIAYIIYTSGSTGKPKGVQITHSNLINFVNAFEQYYNNDISSKDRFLASTNISFDVSIWEIFLPILNGATLVLNEEEIIQNILTYVDTIEKNEITGLYIPPNILEDVYNILKNKEDIKIDKMLVGVEPIRTTVLNKYYNLNNKMIIVNGYGPTETTICCTALKYKKDDTDGIVSIGRPLKNDRIYILSSDQNLQPIGVPGEIYVTGAGVGKGYINKATETEKNFLENIFDNQSDKMYRTGDIAKWNEDGTIKFIGRNDSQVKISGHRIELSEINHTIMEYPSIIKSYTTIKEVEKRKYIVAYYTAEKELSTMELAKYLKTKLADYMIPNYMFQMETFPLTANGKIDKEKLPFHFESNVKYVEPTNKIEYKLTEIYKTLFVLEKVGIDDNFFELGGDSVLAMKLQIETSKEELNITYADIFKHPTIRELAQQVDKSQQNKITIRKCPKASYYPTSTAQKRIYIASSMDKDSTLYNITGGLLMEEEPNLLKLQNAIDKIVQSHDVLRAYFEVDKKGSIIQKICEELSVKIEIVNAKTNDIDEIFRLYQEKFDLDKAPLFRVLLIKMPNQKFLLMLDIHHIIFDGTSLRILLKKISDLYNGKKLEENDISYKDYAVWENTNLEIDGFKNGKEFWLKQFENDIPILNMPTTYARTAKKSFTGNTYTKLISKELTKRIEELAKINDVTPYMIMLSAYYILLYKYTGQEDIIVGTPVSGRIYKELEPMIGMFVNSLPLKQEILPNDNFNKFLLKVKNNCVDCLSHQDYPFDVLVNDLGIAKDTSRNPLFDMMFIYQSEIYKDVNFEQIKAQYCIPKSKTSKFDISLEVTPKNGQMNMSFEYCTELFDEEYISMFAQHYCNILEFIINKPETSIEEIVMLDEAEKNKILYEFNDIKLQYDKNISVVQLFEEQVLKTPENVALVFENKKLTFKELNEKANQLANYLIKNGIGENSVVGIMLPRSLEIMVAIIAVLKAGASYIPIDPTLPNKRIDYMVSNSNVSTMLVKDNISSKINVDKMLNIRLDNIDIYVGSGKNINKKIKPESPSYIIYTSGSTGTPKGVVLSHKALTNLTNYLNNTVEFLKDEYANIAMCSITTISFDIYIFETLICLQRGLKIIIANELEQNTPNLLDKLIEENNVKAIQMTPSRMYIFINNKDIMPHLNNLAYVVLAGEALPKDLLNQILNINPDAKVYNGYGPSETTVFATFTDVTKYNEITIGKPIANTRIYILDKDKNICPIGIPGELYIAGDGIGIGYSNNEQITNERFINDIFYPNEKMYKTGDLAKYLPNGEVHYISRVDNQIKIRGLRIELDEIEKCILQYPNIDKCIIASNTDKNNRQFIVAYLSVTDRVSINKLRAFLKTMLPKYMIPSYFVILDKIPYLNNGKIDKKALAKLKINATEEVEKQYIAPKTKIQIDIANIFQNLLSISPIGIDDNFFELGGDSLLAINLQVELLKKKFHITYSDIFMNPTIRELENLILESKNKEGNNLDLSEISSFDEILKNNCNISEKIQYQSTGDILITGVTGFLGAHVLDEFLKQEKGKAYCLIRSEPGLNVKDKLMKKLHFYFGNSYDKLIGDRIIIVNGDIIEDNLGLEESKLEELFNNISCIINSAAKVSHYGNYNDYKTINVNGTENLLKLCLKFKKKFYQISTLSVSGNQLINKADIVNQQKYIFKEKDFYINQTLDNVYVRSKFEAEKLVFKYILLGLDGYIARVGNLMNRYTDGKFQPNVDENASINRIISVANIGCIPDYITNIDLEFTPVDDCAKAIIKLIQYPSKNNRVFHLLNHNYIDVKSFIDALKNYINIDIVNEKEFTEKINNMLKKEDSNKLLAGILRDLDSEGKLLEESKIKLNSDFTIKYLSETGFEWSNIDEAYLKQFLDYFSNKGYI